MLGQRAGLREVEAHQRVVLHRRGWPPLSDRRTPPEPPHLVVEHVGEPLEEDEREDVVLVLGGVEGATDLARGVPEPLLQLRYVHPSSQLRLPPRTRANSTKEVQLLDKRHDLCVGVDHLSKWLVVVGDPADTSVLDSVVEVARVLYRLRAALQSK